MIRIGNLSTFYRVLTKETTKDASGQRSQDYLVVTNIYGEYKINYLQENVSAGRDNGYSVENIYCYPDPLIKSGMILLEENGQLYRIQHVRQLRDRSTLMLKVKSLSDRELEVVEGVVIEEAITYIVNNLQESARLPAEITLNGELTMTINHNLGRYVVTELIDEDGNVFDAEVDQPDRNQVRITSSIPLVGTLIIY